MGRRVEMGLRRPFSPPGEPFSSGACFDLVVNCIQVALTTLESPTRSPRTANVVDILCIEADTELVILQCDAGCLAEMHDECGLGGRLFKPVSIACTHDRRR